MELITYLLRSILILILFLIIYQLLLRNDAHFKAIRFFLLLGLIAALFLPLAEINYTVVVETFESGSVVNAITPAYGPVLASDVEETKSFNWNEAIGTAYLFITFLFVIRFLIMLSKMLILVRGSQKVVYNGVVVWVNSNVEIPFTFGNRIFVKNKQYLTSGNDEILNHERIHLVQQHWIDVILSELFIVFHWFNPFAWQYARLIKQNLEFLADRGVLESGFNYEKYIETIICETMGAEVSVLANHFRFSQNKRRLKMMKNDKKSKWRLLKLLLVLPILGGLLWAFSEPVYNYQSVSDEINDTFIQDKNETFIVKGYVFSQIDTQMIRNLDTGMYEMKVVGSPLPGTSIVINRTTRGCVADIKGEFELEVAIGDEIVFSFVGFETQVVKVKNKNSIEVVLRKTVYELKPTLNTKHVTEKSTVAPKTKTTDNKEIFYIVEEMPKYKYGMDSYFWKLGQLVDKAKSKEDLSGKVKVKFIINSKGNLQEIEAISRGGETEAKYAIDIVSELNEWKPGKQRGKPVACFFTVGVDFK